MNIKKVKSGLSIAYLSLIFGILYIPILTLIFFSFNSENSTAVFGHFSLRWYKELFNSPETFTALRNTLILAISSATLATVIGTAAAEGIYKMKNKIRRNSHHIQKDGPKRIGKHDCKI